MDNPISVVIVGAPTACPEGIKDTWRETASWAANQLTNRFGDLVQVSYYDLFDLNRPPLPPDAQLPLVLVDGQLLSSGGKISVPAIRKKIEELRAERLNAG